MDIDAEDQVNAFLLAGTLGPGGCVSPDGTVDLDAVRGMVAERIASPDLRRFSQRVSSTGRRLAWVGCVPDLGWHVRAVEPVSGRDGLAALCARLMTTPLPRDRPLWELLVVPDSERAAPHVVLRLHHAVADGVAGVRIAQRLFDPLPAGVSRPQAGALPAARGVRRRSWRSVLRGLARVASVVRVTVSRTVLLGPIASQRCVAFVDMEMGPLLAGARAADATLNDALLAAVAHATAEMLSAAGEPVPPELPASVPVALPDRGSSGNAVGVMLVPLPTGARTTERLRRIASLTAAGKQEARAQGTFELTRSRWGSRLFAALARRQRFVALFVTNVRGPETSLRLAGAPLVHAWPLAPIQGNVRLGVAAFSQAGRLGCAVHVGTPRLDADVFAAALVDELDRIAALGSP